MMKNITALYFLLIMSVGGIAQQDHSMYFAASRLDYYTNEEEGEIMVFAPESKKSLGITIDLVFEFQTLIKGYPVSSEGVTTVPVNMGLLREGQNEITVSFNENAKWVDSRKVFITVRPHRDNAIQIDRASGGLVAGGMPFIPCGIQTLFPVSPEMPEMLAEKGYNYTVPGFEISKKSSKDRKIFMNNCADHGLRAIYDLSGILMPGKTADEAQAGLTIDEKLDLIRSEVELFSGHPALLGWQIAFKPEKNGPAENDLVLAFNLIKEIDPYHPVLIRLSDNSETGSYEKAANILLTRFSPFKGENIEGSGFDRDHIKDFFHQRPVWAVTGDEDLLNGSGRPAPQMIRPAVYLALISGFTGIQFETRGINGNYFDYPLVYKDCEDLAKELSELTPDLTAPFHVPSMITDNPSVQARAWNRLGLVTIVAVNLQDQPASYRASLGHSDLSGMADAIFENRTLKMTGGAIDDMIGGYETRIIRIDARQKTGKAASADINNYVADPGFEKTGGFEITSACMDHVRGIKGGIMMIDSRRYYEGEHSLRMSNPGTKEGKRLCFDIPGLEAGRSYNLSVMARAGGSTDISSGKKGGTVKFRLGVGTTEAVFECTDTWQKYEINVLMAGEQDESTANPLPWIEMAGKGTAWFDSISLQAQPSQ
jgi:hypothetical protein